MLSLELLFKIGFTLGALSLSVFFLGLLGLLSIPYLAAVTLGTLLAIAYFVSFAVKRHLGTDKAEKGGKAHPYTGVEKALLAASVLTVLSIIPLALTPPAVRDELIQHLALPKLYLEAGRIYQIPFMSFSYLPVNTDLLYTVPLAFGSDVTARLMHLGFGVLTALVIYAYLRPVVGRRYALLSFILFVSTPLVLNLSRMAYVDLAAAFYSTLAVVAILKWRDGFSKKWLVFGAVSAGLALGSKYNTLITLFLLTAFIIFTHLRARKDLARAVVQAGVFALIALAVLSPWLLRNYVWTGSPFYPLYKVAVASVAKGEGVHITGGLTPLAKRIFLYKESLADILLLPLRIFWEGRDNSIENFDGVLNPLFLVFIPLAFFRRWMKRTDAGVLLLFSALFFYMAFFTVDFVTRYILPVVPALVVLVTLGVRNAFESQRLRPAGVLVLFVLLAFNTVYAIELYGKVRPFGYITGAETRDEYLTRVLPDYPAVSFANRDLPKDARVAFYFTGDRGYYWARSYSYQDRLGRALKVTVKRAGDADDLYTAFRKAGITHLFIQEQLFQRFVNDNFGAQEKRLLADFFNRRAIRLFSANGFSVFALM